VRASFDPGRAEKALLRRILADAKAEKLNLFPNDWERVKARLGDPRRAA